MRALLAHLRRRRRQPDYRETQRRLDELGWKILDRHRGVAQG